MYAQVVESTNLVPLGRAEPWVEVPIKDQHVRKVRAHDSLFREGDDARFVYEVLEGTLSNYRLLADGRRQVISFSYPGDLIGLSGDCTHKFNCDSTRGATVRCMPKCSLLAAARQRPELGHKLFQVASSELASMQDCFVLLGRKSAIEKIASFLLGLAHRYGQDTAGIVTFDLPMTRADIADFLGMTIETVSRNFTKLRGLGVIDLPQPSMVVIRDMLQLVELSEENGSAC